MRWRSAVNRHLVGAFVLITVALTLTLDVLGVVYPCPYCRTQRAALGILALILVSPWTRVLFWRFIAALAGRMAFVVGVIEFQSRQENQQGRVRLVSPDDRPSVHPVSPSR
ncbi:MAG: disulfide bond formation protein B [Parvularculaceae bacterium]